MIAKAEVRHVRGSASKIRLVIDMVRGMSALEAVKQLKFINKRPVYYVSKALNSAIANAKVKGLNEQDLVISKITADEGPRWKRFRAATFGRAAEILKRTSHITVELDLMPTRTPAPVEKPKKTLIRGRAAKAKSSKKQI